MYLLCDYLVVSAPAVAPVAGEWGQRYFDLLDNPSARTGRMWGYETVSVDGGSTILGLRSSAAGGAFDRALLAVAGAGAETELHGLLGAIGPDVMRAPVSVRRVDFQATVELQDDVNAVIDELRPAPDYAYLRLASSAAGTEGAGLYVGSPRSDVRLRIYNKSADLERKGVLPAPGAGELLRVELILRRQAAQRALHHRAQGGDRMGDMWLAHVCNRVPGLAPILARGREVPPLPRLVDNRQDRATDAWLHKAVLPAIARHYQGNREGLDEFLAAIVERWEKQPWRTSGA
jgi:hypothetical protein